MAPSTRTQNVLIAVLAVLAVARSGFAMWSVGRAHPSLLAGETATTQPARMPEQANSLSQSSMTASPVAAPLSPWLCHWTR